MPRDVTVEPNSRDSDPESAKEVNVSDVIRANLTDKQSLLDSSLPTAAFLVAYLTLSELRPALIAAVGAGVIVAIIRAARKESLRHILTGFVGVAIAAGLASLTGQAEDFFLPGLLLNIAYAAAFFGSALIGKPLVGLGIAALTNDRGAWATFAPLRSAAYRATWLWGGLFTTRVLVQLPLYLLGAVGALGAARLAMGFPLFILGALITQRLLQPALAARKAATPTAQD